MFLIFIAWVISISTAGYFIKELFKDCTDKNYVSAAIDIIFIFTCVMNIISIYITRVWR